jgi:hypothetical protein
MTADGLVIPANARSSDLKLSRAKSPDDVLL